MRLPIKLHYFVPLLLAVGAQQLWADITIDLGPSRVVTNQTDRIAFSDLNGTPVSGTLSLDFTFGTGTFVRLLDTVSLPGPVGGTITFGTTPGFDISLNLQTTSSDFVGFLRGTGYLADQVGNPIPGYGITGSASSNDGGMSIALFPLYKDADGTPNSALSRPLDFYGVHFDLTFPNAPSFQITGAGILLDDGLGEFAIGPNPPVVIPEPSSFALAGLGALTSAFLFRRRP